MMRETTYKGETNDFNFKKYIKIHKQAHWLYDKLEKGKEGKGVLTDMSKLWHFKNGIKDEAGLKSVMKSAASISTFNPYSEFILERLNNEPSQPENNDLPTLTRSQSKKELIDYWNRIYYDLNKARQLKRYRTDE